MIESVNIDDFLEIEKKYNLYEQNIDSINYWVYARFDLWQYILKKKIKLGQAHNKPKMNLKENIQTYGGMVLRSIFCSKLKGKQVDICFINHPRKVLVDNYYTCLYTEEIKEKFENSITLEFPYHRKHFKPVKDDKIIFLDELYIKRGIGKRIYKTIYKRKCKKIFNIICEQIKEPLKEIEEKYDIKLDYKYVINLMRDYVLDYKATIRNSTRLLKKLNPNLVVEVVGYQLDCMVFNEVCKKMDIPTIELQHGIMTNHIAYNYKTDKIIKQLPDKIFLFSDYWKQHLQLPIDDKDIITTGYPFFEKKIKEAKKIEKYNDGKINILFISQGTIGKKLSKVAMQLSRILDAEKFRIIYKLHPGEYSIWKEQYVGLADENIIVLDNNKNVLYDYLATCQVQVGVYSTALYEGLGFGLLTYIYKIEMSEFMTKLNEEGYVKYFSSADELKESICRNMECVQKTDDFWQIDALNNMVKNIKSIL